MYVSVNKCFLIEDTVLTFVSNSGITAALKVPKPRLWSVLYMYIDCIHKYIYRTLVQRPFGKESSQGWANPRGSEAKRTLYFCINISLYLHIEV